MTIRPFTWHGLAYSVLLVEPGTPTYDWRPRYVKSGKVIVDNPPALELRGRVARYALIAYGNPDPERGPVLHAYNMREGQGSWATPFGQQGFTLQGDELMNSHQFRRRPQRRRVRTLRPAFILPPRS